MKTVCVKEPGNVSVIETPIPQPKDYQALVRTELACVCNNTDSELVSGHFPGMEESFPFALGHESIGQIVEVGPRARNFTVGQRDQRFWIDNFSTARARTQNITMIEKRM